MSYSHGNALPLRCRLGVPGVCHLDLVNDSSAWCRPSRRGQVPSPRDLVISSRASVGSPDSLGPGDDFRLHAPHQFCSFPRFATHRLHSNAWLLSAPSGGRATSRVPVAGRGDAVAHPLGCHNSNGPSMSVPTETRPAAAVLINLVALRRMPAGRYFAVRSFSRGRRDGWPVRDGTGKKANAGPQAGPQRTSAGSQRGACRRLSAAMLFGCRQPCPCRRGSGGRKRKLSDGPEIWLEETGRS